MSADGGNIFVRAWKRLKKSLQNYLSPCLPNSENSLWKNLRTIFRRAPRVYPRLDYPSQQLNYEYKMTHTHRGVAMIFNHETFLQARKPIRRATNMDRDRLEKVLTRLHFDVEVFNDLCVKSIKKELKRGEKQFLGTFCERTL